ncbi:MAG TPA: Re/Si-specific NAD(P)(+) transhydrogenase subunit alpha [Gaiellales bacterium]|nr:Re/Si-specific NAD(P)(+) transhydrogenase subunit alpha [Gaiellales bacterium]
MRVGVPREHTAGEHRVALTPDTVQRLAGAGTEVAIERGAGEAASLPDEVYRDAGAAVVDRDELLATADVLVRVGRIEPADLAGMRPGTTLVGYIWPLTSPELVAALAEARITAFGMESVPRVTRAQRMDSLSSQSTVAGYKAVIVAADTLPRFFPMLMTAAGTVAPAKVLVLGAGVAGLQAIATARRLGAVVSAYDTRPVVKEQVQSLGAMFVELDLGDAGGQDARGYATELSEEQQRRQREQMAAHIAGSDVVVTTALVPGRPAPRLIPADAVAGMKPGSVIVDLAAETGGNCELTEPGETVVRHGVTIVGERNLPATMPLHASQMYGRNMLAVLDHLIVDGSVQLDFEDEITADAVITHDGRVTTRLLQKVPA